MAENLTNEELLKSFCAALNKFGTEQKRREKYVDVWQVFTSVHDARELYNSLQTYEMKHPFESRLSVLLKDDRDKILDFIKNANSGGSDEDIIEYA